MSTKDKKLQIIFKILQVVESVYLLTFFVIIFANKFPQNLLQNFTQVWITISFMLLPLFLLKNILVGVLQNGLLSKNDKIWLIARCALFLLLTIYSYPLITSFGFCY